MTDFDTVIFDMDGTTLDTLEDLTDSVNYALARHGCPLRSQAEVRTFVGNGAARLMELSVPLGRANPIFESCFLDFGTHYSLNARNKTEPYKGITELMEALYRKAYKLAIVSNKPDAAVRALAEAYFRPYIKVAVGERPDVRKKPAPDSVLAALEELGSSREKAVYVGDSEVDVQTARNAGLVCVGVSWGFRDKELLASEGADYIIDCPAELLGIIQTQVGLPDS